MASPRRPCDNVSNLLTGLAPPSDDQLNGHRHWLPVKLLYLYLAAAALSYVIAPLASISGGLAQPVIAVGTLKYVVMFMLFATVLSTGSGTKFLLAVVLIEVANRLHRIVLGLQDRFHRSASCRLYPLRIVLRGTNIFAGIAVFCGASRLRRVLDGREVGISRGSDGLFR